MCGKRHTHGGGKLDGNPRQLLGSRSPHCLHVPERLKDKEYYLVEHQDELSLFISDRLDVDAAGQVKAKSMYDTYLSWCVTTGRESSNQTKFGRQLSERLQKVRMENGVVYQGVRLKYAAPAPE